MEQTFENYDLNIMDTNIAVLLKKTKIDMKSHKCNQCNYAATRAGTLRAHLKIHSGEKLNKCNQCDYASSQAGNLRTHLKTHSGEKPNQCNQCDYASIRANQLTKHMKKHF